MIDVIARLGDVTSQRLTIKHVLRQASASEQEIERVLFQFTALEHPIKVGGMSVNYKLHVRVAHASKNVIHDCTSWSF